MLVVGHPADVPRSRARRTFARRALGYQARMSSEERQRILRREGSEPAEAERQEGARGGREALSREEAERRSEERPDSAQATPAAEDDADRPRPRR